MARAVIAAVWLATTATTFAQPFIVSTVPAGEATGVSPNAAFVVTFSEQMDIDLTDAQFFSISPFANLPATAVWSSGNRVMTCTPVSPWPAGTIFWSVSGENIPGDPLEEPTSGSFTVSGGGSTGSGTNRITAFSVGKIHFYNQTSSVAPILDVDVPYNFAANTTLASNRSANSVSLTLPSAAVSNLTQNFTAPEHFYLFSTWTNLSAFNANYPAGNYTFNVGAATSNQLVTVNLPNFVQPNAPRITSYSAAQSVDATQPFILSWDPFQNGTAVDYITVSVGDVFQSPHQGTPGALNGTATSIQIPAGTLQANSNYDASVTFYRTTGSSNASYTTAAYLATSTEFTVITSGGGSTSPLVLTQPLWSGGVFSFDVTSSPGQTFTVEYSTTLMTNQWQTLLTTNSPTGRLRINQPATNPYRFYRARKGA